MPRIITAPPPPFVVPPRAQPTGFAADFRGGQDEAAMLALLKILLDEESQNKQLAFEREERSAQRAHDKSILAQTLENQNDMMTLRIKSLEDRQTEALRSASSDLQAQLSLQEKLGKLGREQAAEQHEQIMARMDQSDKRFEAEFGLAKKAQDAQMRALERAETNQAAQRPLGVFSADTETAIDDFSVKTDEAILSGSSNATVRSVRRLANKAMRGTRDEIKRALLEIPRMIDRGLEDTPSYWHGVGTVAAADAIFTELSNNPRVVNDKGLHNIALAQAETLQPIRSQFGAQRAELTRSEAVRNFRASRGTQSQTLLDDLQDYKSRLRSEGLEGDVLIRNVGQQARTLFSQQASPEIRVGFDEVRKPAFEPVAPKATKGVLGRTGEAVGEFAGGVGRFFVGEEPPVELTPPPPRETTLRDVFMATQRARPAKVLVENEAELVIPEPQPFDFEGSLITR